MPKEKKTALAKIQEAAENLATVSSDLADFDEVISLTDNPRVQAKMRNARLRAQEDVKYLENRIRGIIARDGNLSKLVQHASELFS